MTADTQAVTAGEDADRLRSAATALSDRIERMGAAARSGQLRIDPDSGRALYRALLEQLDRVESWIEVGGGLAAPIPFGAQWVGEAMSGKFTGRVDGSGTALLPVLRQLRGSVAQAADAIGATMSDYARAEEDSLARLGSAGTPR